MRVRVEREDARVRAREAARVMCCARACVHSHVIDGSAFAAIAWSMLGTMIAPSPVAADEEPEDAALPFLEGTVGGGGGGGAAAGASRLGAAPFFGRPGFFFSAAGVSSGGGGAAEAVAFSFFFVGGGSAAGSSAGGGGGGGSSADGFDFGGRPRGFLVGGGSAGSSEKSSDSSGDGSGSIDCRSVTSGRFSACAASASCCSCCRSCSTAAICSSSFWRFSSILANSAAIWEEVRFFICAVFACGCEL